MNEKISVNMADILIRNASNEDVPLILGLLYELGRPKPQNDSQVDDFQKLVKKYIKDSDKQILVAQVNDTKIAGMTSLIFLSRLNQIDYELYIPELVVAKTYQKQGIGKKLLKSCIDIAQEKQCHRIRLESANQRKDSHEFYRSLGFEQSALSFTKIIS